MPQSYSSQHPHIHTSIQGEGEPIVFLHGWPTNSHLWDAQVEELSKTHQTITLDWPGFGKSDKAVDHSYTFGKNKEILDVVLAELLPPDQTITLIVHDIGGPSGILWASEHPDRIKRLILLNTVIYPFSTPLDKISHSLFRMPLIKDIIASSFGLRTLMGNLLRGNDKSSKSRIRTIIAAHGKMRSKTVMRSILEPLKTAKQHEFQFLAQEFQLLPAEKHLIIAKGDPLCFAHINRLHEENPEVPVHFIDRCGHFIQVDQPDALNQVLREIVGQQ